MAGTTAVTSLDDLTDRLSSRLTDPLPAADVEAELQRIARRRLALTTQIVVASGSHRSTRSFRQRRQPLVGAFDSPAGFAFGSDGPGRKS